MARNHALSCFDYDHLAELLHQGHLSEAQQQFGREVDRVCQIYLQEETACVAAFKALDRHRRQHGQYPKSLSSFVDRVLRLIKYGRYNDGAITKWVRLARSIGGYGYMPSAEVVLSNSHMYTSMEPVRILCRLPRHSVTLDALSNEDEAPPATEHPCSAAHDLQLFSDDIDDNFDINDNAREASSTLRGECIDEQCAICLSARMVDAGMCSCGHVFCYACISHVSSLCPICRKPHFNTLAMVGSGDIVQLESDDDAPASVLQTTFNYARDMLWYLFLSVLLLPFLAILVGLGVVWNGLRQIVSLAMGPKTEIPAPLRYERFPMFAPQHVDTTPPPWTAPSLWTV
eukprot:m.50144 g.50144  ORF g.50144 m.50144 type:complete len:344 (-) comp13396_c0_seq2:70-1101(-)